MAAEQRDATAQNNLFMCDEGEEVTQEVTQDDKEAVKWCDF